MKKISYTLLLILAFLFSSNILKAQDEKNLIVLVKYKVRAGAENQALISLKQLIDKVKREPNYVKILIHIDQSEKSNIMLYEEWADEEYYKGEHMKTDHLQKFIGDSKDFLTGPPEITFWRIQKN